MRNVYQKLESDLQSSKKRFAELVDQCDALKKGREESVSMPSFNSCGNLIRILLNNDKLLNTLLSVLCTWSGWKRGSCRGAERYWTEVQWVEGWIIHTDEINVVVFKGVVIY